MEAAHTPLHIFFLLPYMNFPDVAATSNKQLNEHLSVGDSSSACEGLSGGCGWEVSLPPWTACNDVKLIIVKKSLLLCSKQQQPSSAAHHLKPMWQKGQPENGFQLHQDKELPPFPADARVGVAIHSGFVFCVKRQEEHASPCNVLFP